MDVMFKLIPELIAAFIGTVAFCALFHTPVKQYVLCGLTGALGWLVYALLILVIPDTFACFFASLAISLSARVFAVWRQVPSNMFICSGIFPVIPGTGIYYTIYELMNGSGSAALSYGLGVFKMIAAIVLGIVCAFIIPNSVFAKLKRS